jgi:transcriptional regulator with XRE-family HTH domain
MNNEPLGKKIETYRKRANLSQFDLELAIDAASGSISRIENGKTNPTKETLLAIVDTLKLTKQEKIELFGISKNLPPTEAEVGLAIEEVQVLLNTPGRLIYLVDDWWTLRAVSKTLIDFLNIPSEQLNTAYNKDIVSVFFDPAYGVRKTIDPEYLVQSFAIELARIKGELDKPEYGDYYTKILQSISKTPQFEQILEESKKYEKDVILAGERTSHLILNNQKLTLHHGREKLKQNPRFEMIHLFP